MYNSLELPVSSLPLVGPAYVDKLAKLGIHTLEDLLHYYPFRHIDSSLTTTINTLQGGEQVTLQGMVLTITNTYTRYGKTLQKAMFSDGTGIMPITWFNQPYLVKSLQLQPHISVSGTVKVFHNKPSLTAPQFEYLRSQKSKVKSQNDSNDFKLNASDVRLNDIIHTGRLVPVYSETVGISSKWIRSRIKHLIDNLPPQSDFLPSELNLPDYDWSLRQIHFPDNQNNLEQAHYRLSFNELFLWQLMAQVRKQQRVGLKNYHQINSPPLEPVLSQLPFTLTRAQIRVIDEIIHDLSSTVTMNRLIQGDVGSGKTIVAALSMYAMYLSGFRSVLMAPTELLAHQHLRTITTVLSPLGVKVVGATKTHKNDLKQADVVVGTHAVLFRELPPQIGLVVIDEQHRFGVEQRGKLLDHVKPPHLLSMTATPIPRTVALTLYAELDMSVIDEMPAGRKIIKTRVVTADKRTQAYEWLRSLVKQGGQIYLVCPLIAASELEDMNEIKAAEAEYIRLSKEVFPDLRLGLVHGQMKSKQKDDVIKQFADKQLDILVATSVIEVGIDIPNANVMVIEGAERFGLAQLHQLRGRVGRGSEQSYCLLFSTHDSEHATKRLHYLETTHSGFELANIDLKLRGPGDVYGTRQAGFIDLKIATLDDEKLIQQTHEAAKTLIQADPQLSAYPTIKVQLEHLIHSLTAPN